MKDATEVLTIAEAAARLDVPERTLRHVLKRPEYAAQTRQETRQTKTGTRQSTLLSAALLPDLAQHFAKWENPAEHGNPNAARTRQEAANPAEENTAEHGRNLIPLYSMLLQEKDARLLDAQSQIASLERALEHEREQSRRLVEALAREQMLRALPPAPVNETRQEAAENTANAAEAEQTPPEPPHKAWWKFWERG